MSLRQKILEKAWCLKLSVGEEDGQKICNLICCVDISKGIFDFSKCSAKAKEMIVKVNGVVAALDEATKQIQKQRDDLLLNGKDGKTISAKVNLINEFLAVFGGKKMSLKQKIEKMILEHENDIKSLKEHPTLNGMHLIACDNGVLAVLYNLNTILDATKQFLTEFDSQACRCDDGSLCAVFEKQGEDCEECGIFALRKWVKEKLTILEEKK